MEPLDSKNPDEKRVNREYGEIPMETQSTDESGDAGMQSRYFMDMLTPEEQKRAVRLSSVCELEKMCLSQYPEAPAVDTGEALFTYRRLWGRVARVRGFLKRQGIGKGDRIAVILPNSAECIVVFLALSTFGAVPVMISASLPSAAKTECAAVAGCRQAFHEGKLAGLDCWPADPADAEAEPAAFVLPEDAAAAFFTGGTSGTLKCALLSHRALMTGSYFGLFAPSPVFGQRYFGLIPFSHIFGVVRNLLTCLQSGGVIRPCANMGRLVPELQAFQPTVLVLIPALAGMLLRLADVYGKEIFGGRLHLIVTGGAPQPVPVAKTYIEKYGIRFVSGYGLTETANLVSGNNEVLEKAGSVGKLYGLQEIRFVNGEIELRGENIFSGYLNDPAETEAAFDDGWLRTGDLGYLDADGYLYITGRLKNLIYSPGGEKISPEQIEARVDRLPGVRASMVSMKKNALNADVLTCEIVKEPSAEEALLREAVELINLELPAFSGIRQVIFRTEDFPRTAAMKIIRS